MTIKRCQWCKHSIARKDGETPFVNCAVLPPQPVVVDGKLEWLRPAMAVRGWCGQFTLSLRRLFGYGPRA